MYNLFQTKVMLACPKYSVNILGRGAGKSSDLGRDTKMKAEVMPRALGGFVTRNFKIALERSLPAMLKIWEEMGWREYNERDGGEYVLFRKPPAHWPQPYSKRVVPERCLFTHTGTALQLITQEREDSARGFDLDFIHTDEGLTLKPEHFKRNVLPAMRGNRGKFNTHLHHGFYIASSMGWDGSFQWLLDYGNYYEEDGHKYEQLHRLLPELYLALVDAPTAEKRQEIWENHIYPIKKQLVYYVSKEDVFYCEGTSFDNLANLGLDYILNLRRNLTDEEFLIEVLNMRYDVGGESFYPDTNPMCYDMDDESGLEVALIKKAAFSDTCMYDLDVDKSRPIDIAFDAQASINPWVAGQLSADGKEYRILKDGHVKAPQRLEDAVKQIAQYYSCTTKVFNLIYDHTFVGIRPDQGSIIGDILAEFTRQGCTVYQHRINQQPGHYERYRLWNKLGMGNHNGPKLTFNYERTKGVRRAMQLTKVLRHEDGFKKDKRAERKDNVDQATTTHKTDALDTLVWHRYNNLLKEGSTTAPLIL